MKLRCTTCENLLSRSLFTPSQLKKTIKNPNLLSVGKCKPCAKEYQESYREKQKDKKLSSNNKPIQYKNRGILYIIGTRPEGPLKIGITSGNRIEKRITALQTSHWEELKIYLQYQLEDNLHDIERHLHSLYKDKRIRGEWFNIGINELEEIKNTVYSYSTVYPYCVTV